MKTIYSGARGIEARHRRLDRSTSIRIEKWVDRFRQTQSMVIDKKYHSKSSQMRK